MNSSAKELINKIKTIRKEKRLSQIELAKRCNVPQSTIGRIENYSMNPSIDTLINILDVLNIKIELKEKRKILKGYDVFGKAYGYMLRNDLHDKDSIEHKLLQEQIKLDSVSEPLLYGGYQVLYSLENHELYLFSQKFKTKNELESLKLLVKYTSELASNFNVPLKDMYFGGTEKEILSRGTDWCFDLASSIWLNLFSFLIVLILSINSFAALFIINTYNIKTIFSFSISKNRSNYLEI